MSNDSKKNSQVIVRKILPGSPAAKAGVKEGDVIVSINNHPVYTFDDYIELTNAGVPYEMEVLRNRNQLISFYIEINYNPSAPVDHAKIIDQFEQSIEEQDDCN